MTEIGMTAEGLSLTNDSGVEQGMVRYSDDPAASVALLTEVFKAEPVVSPGGALNHNGVLTNYRWGGFILQTQQDPADPAQHWMGANFVASDSGSVRLVGPSGLSVGDPARDALDPIAVGSYEGTPDQPRRLLGEPVPFTLGEEGNLEEYFYYVQAFEDPTGETLIELVAPVASFGGTGWEVLTYTGRA